MILKTYRRILVRVQLSQSTSTQPTNRRRPKVSMLFQKRNCLSADRKVLLLARPRSLGCLKLKRKTNKWWGQSVWSNVRRKEKHQRVSLYPCNRNLRKAIIKRGLLRNFTEILSSPTPVSPKMMKTYLKPKTRIVAINLWVRITSLMLTWKRCKAISSTVWRSLTTHSIKPLRSPKQHPSSLKRRKKSDANSKK